MYKNHLYIDALEGKKVSRPPVWMMRQAGRYLPEFMKLKNQYDFFTRCQTPELATEITLMPIQRYPLDAAILFSDILVIPQAMGLPFEMRTGVGPFLENPIRSKAQIETLQDTEVEDSLSYVYEAIKMTIKELDHSIPLIGFAGSPWTIFCYCVEGHGSKTFSTAKAFAYQHPEWAHSLLQKITNITIAYLKKKIESGVAAVQLFDSWGGLLSPADYNRFSWPYINQIIEVLTPETYVIVFAKGCWYFLEEMAESHATAIGLDWTVQGNYARALTGEKTLQGNFDPSKLMAPPEIIYQETQAMIKDFGVHRYIANLGHGILPEIPVENAGAFVQAVVDYQNDESA